MPDPAYAELHCLSNFTFLRGAAHPEELVRRAAALGYRALALTDECSLAGIVRAHVSARELDLKLIVGTELVLQDGLSLVMLAADHDGYRQLSMLISRGRRRGGKGSYVLTRDDVAEHAAGCLALWLPPADCPDAADCRWVSTVFPGRCWIAVELFYSGADRIRLETLRSLGRHCGVPLVAAGDVHMHDHQRQPLADTLAAIRLGKPLASAVAELPPNAERHLRPPVRLARIYPAELLAETVAVAERCSFDLGQLRYSYPREIVPEGQSPTAYLRALTEAGMRWRWPDGVAPRVGSRSSTSWR